VSSIVITCPYCAHFELPNCCFPFAFSSKLHDHVQEVSKAQAASRARLDPEYRRLVDNLVLRHTDHHHPSNDLCCEPTLSGLEILLFTFNTVRRR
jgi:hypothetical protein